MMPKTHRDFPTELSPDEKKLGFRLVTTQIPPENSDTTVAALYVGASARILKFRPLPLFEGDSAIGYLLEVYGRDTHSWTRGKDKARWRLVWDGPSSTIEGAIRRVQAEPIDPNIELLDPSEGQPDRTDAASKGGS